jgi:hypothetical protein
MNVSNAEPSAASAGENPSVSSEDIQNYVTTVDNLLLDVPWRRRRELIADLQEHLREHPDQITVEQPQDYVAELRAAAGAVPGGFLSGFRSTSWPTPLEWWESVVRGAAIVLVALAVWELLAHAGQKVFGDAAASGEWSWIFDSALQSVYPVPPLLGSHRTGLIFYPLLSVLIGQLTTGAYLGRSPHGRPALRRLSYVSLVIILVLLGYGAMRSIG